MWWLVVPISCVVIIAWFAWPCYKADKALKELARQEKARDAMRRF